MNNHTRGFTVTKKKKEACPEHPKFSGKAAPRASEKNPQGCAKCWDVHERLQYGSAEIDDEVGVP